MVDTPAVDPLKLKRLHYWSGLALLSAQQIEYGFKYLLWQLTDRKLINFDPERATDLMEGRAKLTMGQVLKVLAEHVSISDDAADVFRDALDARNKFIHGFLIDRTEEIADPATREGVISEIKSFRRRILDGDVIVRRAVGQMMALYGINYDAFLQSLDDEIRAKNRVDASQ